MNVRKLLREAFSDRKELIEKEMAERMTISSLNKKLSENYKELSENIDRQIEKEESP